METPVLSRRDAILGKIRGETIRGIPVATYNLHPYGPHGRDPSYAPLLEHAAKKAGFLVKHRIEQTVHRTDRVETRVERTPAHTRTTTTWHTPKGDLRSVFLKPTGQPGYTVEHFIKEDADIERVLSLPPEKVRFDLTTTRQALHTLGGQGVLYASYRDPLYSAASLFDFQDFCLRCATDPDPIHDLVEYFFTAIAAEVEELAATCQGLPILFGTSGPEVATPPMLSPAVFARFVTPFQKRLIATFHRYALPTCIHCHGRVRHVLDEILETGTDALEPIEPPPQGDISLPELLERVQGRLCLVGHIQDQDFYLAPPGGLRARVAEIAAIVEPTSRYVMTPTCTPFQFPAASRYVHAYIEWLDAAAELLPGCFAPLAPSSPREE
ncbi:MAG: uroporphyrinogen decarboxylase family protein [Armatimonadota bacterium]|nr:uroporphyrinogen decarboxylase family protein [Armatimonadota bacterium]